MKTKQLLKIKQLSRFIPSLFSFLLFGLSLWAISQQLRHYHPKEVWNGILAIPPLYVVLGIALTGLNYIMLTGYDTLAVHYIRHPLAYYKTALAAVISYAISNSVGLALLSGSAIRYRLYRSWGLNIGEIAKIIAFCNLSFWLGLFAVGGLVFMVEPLQVPTLLHLPFTSVHPLGAIFLILVLIYLLTSIFRKKSLNIGKLEIPHLSLGVCLLQIAITSLDWSIAAAILYFLLPHDIPLSYAGFFGIYLLAQIAGIVSNVPGGLGVFETVIVLLLSSSVSSAEVLASLLAYRGIYYFLPLITAIILLGTYELYERSR